MATSIIPSSDKITYNLAATYSGTAANIRVDRSEKVCNLQLGIESNTVFSNATGSDIIAQVPSDCKPSESKYGVLIARTSGIWAEGTYYLAAIIVDSAGNVSIRGNANNLRQCKYITGGLTYLV